MARYCIPFFALLIASIGLGSAQGEAAPSVALTFPTASSIIDADVTPVITLSAAASAGDVPIESVIFRICNTFSTASTWTCSSSGNVSLAPVTAPPYQAAWTYPGFSPTHNPTVVLAYAQVQDTQGNSTVSPTIAFTVLQLTGAPGVNLIVPAQTNALTTPVFALPAAPVLYATASATSPSTIARVEFLDGPHVVGALTEANSVPSGYAVVWDDPSPGAHQISVRATDSHGRSTQSGVVPLYIVAASPPPQVTLTSPLSGQILSPEGTLALSATASSSTRTIQRVEFVAGSTVVATAFAPPYSGAWLSPPPGTYSIVARAYDDFGQATASPASYIQVLHQPRRPLVILTSPTPATSVAAGSPVAVSATALSPDGSIDRVEFYADSTLIATATSPPYTTTWPTQSVGSYLLTAKVYDARGANGTSASLPVTITATTPPTVALTAPADGSTFTAPATIAMSATAHATDASVAKVDFFANAALIATRAAAPYIASWDNVSQGDYALTAKVTDSRGATAVSTPINVTVQTNSTISITLAAPLSGARYSQGQPITLTAIADAPSRIIDRVEFYSDGTRLSAITVTGGVASATVNFVWSGGGAGAHVLLAKVFTTDGANAASGPVNVAISDLSVALVEPSAGQVYPTPADIRMSAIPTEAGGTIARVDFYGDGGLVNSASTAPYAAFWNAVPEGTHTIRARVIDSTGLAADSTVVTISVRPLGLTILAPSAPAGAPPGASASLASDFALVYGTYVGPANTGVTVNGEIADTDGAGHFAINNFPIALGDNALDVVLTTIDGSTTHTTLPVVSTARAAFKISALPTDGFVPLTVSLSARSRGVGPAKTVLATNLGGGTFDGSAFDGETLGTITYSAPGFYLPQITLTYGVDQTFTQTVAIVVRDVATMDRMYVDMFNRIIGALRTKDTGLALQFFTEPTRGKYGAAFESIKANLPQIVESFKGIGATSFSRDVSEYALKRTTNGKTKIFLLDFLRDADGVWRLDSM